MVNFPAMMPSEVTSRFAVPSISVAEAKTWLPKYLDLARAHELQIVTRHDRDEVALVSLEDFRELLRDHKFETDVAIHTDEATVTLPQFRIIGIGSTVDEATEDALAKLREYAPQYLKRLDFYKETDRRDLYPLVMRFLATPEDEQLELLLEPEPVEAELVPA
ncbi:MAG: type II toxin-antitoxin system Phd/YefM family antitoxin [Candidatus Limnocylindria bacterium]